MHFKIIFINHFLGFYTHNYKYFNYIPIVSVRPPADMICCHSYYREVVDLTIDRPFTIDFHRY